MSDQSSTLIGRSPLRRKGQVGSSRFNRGATATVHAHLRALYRQHGEAGYAIVAEEADRLGIERGDLPHILKSAWTEGRELAGWTYDKSLQRWRRADGSVVVEDTGEEWLP